MSLTPWATLVVLTGIAYLLGSIPFGLVVTRLLKGIDLRTVGSGNIGAANAFRALGPVGGVLVLALDLVKGLLPVLACERLFIDPPGFGPSIALAKVIVGVAAIVGHNNSIYLGFKGGKGIATTFGVVIGMSPLAAGVAALTWAAFIGLFRIASVASLAAATSIPITFYATRAPIEFTILGAVACVLAFYKHRGNLQNLMAGKERRITDKADSAN